MSEADLQVIWAIKNGDVDEVKSFVDRGVDVTKVEVAGRKAIHFAADCGQLDVLEFLIHMGAEINAPDRHGYTALLSAIYEGHADCVKLLVSKGANKTGKCPDGKSYSEIAETPEMRELLK